MKYPEPLERYPTAIQGPFTHVGLDIIELSGWKQSHLVPLPLKMW